MAAVEPVEAGVSCGRQTGSLWFYLFRRRHDGKWWGREVFTRRFWRNRYIWHDTLGKYLNRLFVCPFGHRHIVGIEIYEPTTGQDRKARWCFTCEREVRP